MGTMASAPGKLVVAGDYAVLEGAPAVVMALNRRAQVTLDDSEDGGFCVDAAEMDIHQAHARLEAGILHWQDALAAERLHLVTAVLEHLAGQGVLTDGFYAHLDTQTFFSANRRRDKLGLGSSAALLVALVGAIHARYGLAPPDLETMLAMHRSIQGGRGSGLDIAASLLGGVLVYRLQKDGRPHAVQGSWPRELALCCVWTGRPASTGQALEQLAQWRRNHPAGYDKLMNELTVEASAVAAALQADDAAAMVDGIAAYASGLERLGQASGIDIVCAEHRAVADLAEDCGVVYKTCGAGGGDVGIACAIDTDRLKHFAQKVDAAGFHILGVGVDAQGLAVETSIPCNRRQSWTTCA